MVTSVRLFPIFVTLFVKEVVGRGSMGYIPMCPRFYVSMSLCVHISMCPRFYVANIMPNRPFVAMVLCVQSSLWPWFYVAPDVQIDPLCRRSYVSRIQCDQCSMCPWLYVAIVYMLLYSNPNQEKVFGGTVLPNKT